MPDQMHIPLEDDYTDVLGKAQRGLGLTDPDLALRAGVSAGALREVKAGRFDAGALEKLAPVLGLDATALAGLPEYHPAAVAVPGLEGFSTAFGGMRVNSFLVWDDETREAATFDTGADCTPLLDALARKGLTLRFILLTHGHTDHVQDLDRLRARTGAPAFASSREQVPGVEPFEAGREFVCGRLRIEPRLTWGHSRGGITYVVRGLERLVAVVGDALFAGSMGGGMVSYRDALETGRQEILSLPPETVICPGHGPMTTVGAELRHNPFFAHE